VFGSGKLGNVRQIKAAGLDTEGADVSTIMRDAEAALKEETEE